MSLHMVKCIDDAGAKFPGGLEKGRVYRVIGACPTFFTLEGHHGGWYRTRFEEFWADGPSKDIVEVALGSMMIHRPPCKRPHEDPDCKCPACVAYDTPSPADPYDAR